MKKLNLNTLFAQSLNNKIENMIKGGGPNDDCICVCGCRKDGVYNYEFNSENGKANMRAGKASPGGGTPYSPPQH